MKYYIKTYGCAMNYADSRRISEIMKSNSFTEVNSALKADIIILTSCSIRQSAEDKILGWGIKTKKKEYKDKIIVLTGCMAVRYNRQNKNSKTSLKYTEKLKRQAPWIDFILPITNINKLPDLIKKEAIKNFDKSPESLKKENLVGEALIPISTGCNNFCSYCIVPYTRGPLKNFSTKLILEKVEEALSQDKKLITLLGQNVNSWIDTYKGNKIDFAGLIELITTKFNTEEYWINFLSSNPHKWNTHLTEVITKNSKVMKWSNIAIQSGSNVILEKMNRKYKVEDFIKIVEKIKKTYPKFSITTDIIVGFPGETDEEFQKTLDLIKRLKFNMVYAGKYSPRVGTLSAKLYSDKIPLKVKKNRERTLKDLVNKLRLEYNKRWINKKISILTTSKKRGVSYFNHDVIFNNELKIDQINTFVRAKVKEANKKGLKVEI